mgnify:CR=1 FL=1
MYGMVNKAVRGFVLKNFDEETWTRIHTDAGVDSDFVSMKSYDDDVTYNLVGSTNKLLGIEVPDILNGFGRFWVSDIAVASYSDLMSKSGVTFVDFVKNLDHLHERIKTSFPNYRPPSFRVIRLSPDEVQVDYYSHREGLLPFVVGLFEGLAIHFNEQISISHLDDDSHPMPCKRMIVTIG